MFGTISLLHCCSSSSSSPCLVTNTEIQSVIAAEAADICEYVDVCAVDRVTVVKRNIAYQIRNGYEGVQAMQTAEIMYR